MPAPTGELPWALSLLLKILAVPYVLYLVLLPVIAVLTGREHLIALAMVMVPLAVLTAISMVSYLKLIFLAGEIKLIYGLIGGAMLVLGFLNNLVSGIQGKSTPWSLAITILGYGLTLLFVGYYWRYAYRIFLYYAGATIGLMLFSYFLPTTLMDEAFQRNEFANGQRPRTTLEDEVKLVVTGVPSPEAGGFIAEKIRAILDQQGARRSLNSSSKGDIWTYIASPVADPRAFADRIEFGKVTSVDDRSIEVEAGPIDEQDLAAQAAFKAEFDPKKHRPGPPGDIPDERGADTVTSAIRRLASQNPQARKTAVRQLASATPVEERREEVQKSLRPLLDDPDVFLVINAITAMAVWKTSETVPALIGRTSDGRFGVRWHAIETLGNLKDPRAAEAIVARLKEDGNKSQPALRQLGPVAEPAVLAQLRSQDPEIRRKACEVLADIGGDETLKFMRQAKPDPDFGVRLAAQQAMQAIAARVDTTRSP